jgi:nucleoid-associated protein YgaU
VVERNRHDIGNRQRVYKIIFIRTRVKPEAVFRLHAVIHSSVGQLPDGTLGTEEPAALTRRNGERRLAAASPNIPPRSTPMTDADLKNKYQPVADFMSRNGFQIQHFHVENGKAVLTATAPTEYLKNRAWDEIKKVDPSFADLQHNIAVGSGTVYVVKSGDNLYNISKSFYGNPNESTKIAQANNIANPDRIQVGQQLRIPAA